MKKVLLSTLLSIGLLHAGSIALNVNSNDVEVEGRLDITSAIGYGSGTTYFLGGDYLHTDNDNLFKATFGASNTLSGAEGLSFTLGLEGVFADNYVAMPFFGEAALRLPLDEPIPATTLLAKLSYAPSVLSFVDADGYLEYRLEADMEVISNIHIYGGYRNIDTDYETHDYNLNDSWYGGLKISF
jgi:hypothetical protein